MKTIVKIPEDLVMTRSAAARILGLSAARVGQLLQEGMPSDEGLIPIGSAIDWYTSHVATTASTMHGRTGIQARLQEFMRRAKAETDAIVGGTR